NSRRDVDWGFAVCSGVLVSIDKSDLWRFLRVHDKDIKVVVSTEQSERRDLGGAGRAGIHVDPT
ncbi:MAG: hypothetical protein QGI34_17760, partial [Candidatus Latescibacteria bacterium]|nr:hypothetical protein [Candidatus Latescibacterota bacterium]